MSALSDKYEQDVAKYIDSIPGVKAIRPPGDTGYADVKVTYGTTTTWVEVKMSHTDNLSNPRVYYSNGLWKTTYTTPAAKAAVEILNKSSFSKDFVNKIAKFAGIPVQKVKIPTTKGGLKEDGAVPLDVMKRYFDQPNVNRYIANQENYNLGKLVTEHYTLGKKEPAYYMQAGDDFYLISKTDPLKLGSTRIPLLSGMGDFKVRIATRSEFYEVQAEIKITKMPNSHYSLKPGTKKKNPFLR
jgi:hypothetical protein